MGGFGSPDPLASEPEGSGGPTEDWLVPVEECDIAWKRGEMIGKGAFGKVYLALNQDTGSLIAVKRLELERDPRNLGRQMRWMRSLQLEIAMMASFDHANIVRYYGTQQVSEREEGASYSFRARVSN